MKKISLIKKLGLSAVAVTAIVPATISATSCSNSNAIVTRYASYKAVKNGIGQTLDCLKSGKYSNDSLLLGSKKFYNGNYILFIGTNTNEGNETKKFFAYEDASSDVNAWFDEEGYSNSYWFSDILNLTPTINEKIKDDFGLVSFIDNFDFKFYDTTGHEIYITDDASNFKPLTKINPFKKWDDNIIAQTKEFNKTWFKYDWDEESVDTDDYIRQDAQAKAYRALCQRGLAMFPIIEGARTKSFDVSDACKPMMVIYKDGQLKEIQDLPAKAVQPTEIKDDLKDTSTLFGTINNYFTEEDEE